MSKPNETLQELLNRVETLAKKQSHFAQEIEQLQTEIKRLQSTASKLPHMQPEPSVIQSPSPAPPVTVVEPIEPGIQSHIPDYASPKGKSDWEKFIGENLINKIGIAITIIGVAIGAKYSIEHNLISPLTRIVLGYLFGLGLLGLGVRLKTNYENYSAVLVSGAMAILYFITYFAYDLYGLMPQAVAFILMVVFTLFTVYTALRYNRQLIAHIGLVGAYAVPFLLSDGSGRAVILFSYMALLNSGILVLAFKKYWKSLYYVSFALSWFIFLVWYVFQYEPSEHFTIALVFVTLFFAIFYVTALAYKLSHREKFATDDVVLLLSNAFVFYALGYAVIEKTDTGALFLGLFTAGNALIHLFVTALLYRNKHTDTHLFYLIAGLVPLFVTIAIAVQFDGHWVSILWAGEAVLLFWIGRKQKEYFYEKLAYPLMVLAFFSILQDWTYVYDVYDPSQPHTRIPFLVNVHFLTSLLCMAAYGGMHYINQTQSWEETQTPKDLLPKMVSVFIPAFLIFLIYFAFRLEFATYWNQLYADSAQHKETELSNSILYLRNYDLLCFKSIWVLNYTLFFVSALAILNYRRFQNQLLTILSMGLIMVSLLIFLTQGLYNLSELRESYLQPSTTSLSEPGRFYILFRYVSFVFVSLALYAFYGTIQQLLPHRNYTRMFTLMLHIVVLWISSSELIHWMDMGGLDQAYKLGLSILWGLYSLIMIALGIWKKNKTIRIAAIVLFGFTLLKLFFYDISHLNTISKTIVFVSLGILLLIISFLYNKYKLLISDNDSENDLKDL